MYYYIKGIITEINADSLVLENGGIGYSMLVSHPEDYQRDSSLCLYVHQVIRDDEHFLIGFGSKEERDIFLKLINVKGIGPKTAINALTQTRPAAIMAAIAASDANALKKLPGIGAKAASQIILDLKGELLATTDAQPTKLNESKSELKEVLKNFGYKVGEIERILPSIDDNLSVEEMVRDALKLLRK